MHINNEKFWNKVDIKSDVECWEWLGSKYRNGYGRFNIGNNKVVTASRVSYYLTYDDFDLNNKNIHKCDNPSCVNPNHLFMGTQKDNMKDMVLKGRGGVPGIKGSQIGTSKLTEDEVYQIKKRLANKESKKLIAEDYNVSLTMVCYIADNKWWRHIKINEEIEKYRLDKKQRQLLDYILSLEKGEYPINKDFIKDLPYALPKGAKIGIKNLIKSGVLDEDKYEVKNCGNSNPNNLIIN